MGNSILSQVEKKDNARVGVDSIARARQKVGVNQLLSADSPIYNQKSIAGQPKHPTYLEQSQWHGGRLRKKFACSIRYLRTDIS